jgi:hypothetical protein
MNLALEERDFILFYRQPMNIYILYIYATPMLSIGVDSTGPVWPHQSNPIDWAWPHQAGHYITHNPPPVRVSHHSVPPPTRLRSRKHGSHAAALPGASAAVPPHQMLSSDAHHNPWWSSIYEIWRRLFWWESAAVIWCWVHAIQCSSERCRPDSMEHRENRWQRRERRRQPHGPGCCGVIQSSPKVRMVGSVGSPLRIGDEVWSHRCTGFAFHRRSKNRSSSSPIRSSLSSAIRGGEPHHHG